MVTKRTFPEDEPDSQVQVKTARRLCSEEGCNNDAARKGGVCEKHGAKKTPKICSHEGCNNLAQKRGVCDRHGAKPMCSNERCTNVAKKGGYCRRHHKERSLMAGEAPAPEKVKRKCSTEGCNNLAQLRGVCDKHGARPKCSHDGCNNVAKKGELCWRHDTERRQHEAEGSAAVSSDDAENAIETKRDEKEVPAKRAKRICSADGCSNWVVRGGVCISHGAKQSKSKCNREGCTNFALKRGVCRKHGAEVRQCSHEGCTHNAVKGGVCVSHGARKQICSNDGCTNQAVKGGVCIRHGAKSTEGAKTPSKRKGKSLPGGKVPAKQVKRINEGANKTGASFRGRCGHMMRHNQRVCAKCEKFRKEESTREFETGIIGIARKHGGCNPAKGSERKQVPTIPIQPGLEQAVIPDGTLHLPDKLNHAQKGSVSERCGAKDGAMGGEEGAGARPTCIHEECNSTAEKGGVACIEHGELYKDVMIL